MTLSHRKTQEKNLNTGLGLYLPVISIETQFFSHQSLFMSNWAAKSLQTTFKMVRRVVDPGRVIKI